MTGEIVALSAAEARRLTDDIRASLTVAWERLAQAFTRRAWTALGYDSWESYCSSEFGAGRMVRLAQPQRAEIAAELREVGMSTRAIGSAMGVGHSTVAEDLKSTVRKRTVEPPAPIQSLDGRTRPATQPPRPQPASVSTPEPDPVVQAEPVDDPAPESNRPSREDLHEQAQGFIESSQKYQDDRYLSAFYREALRLYAGLSTFDVDRLAQLVTPRELADLDSSVADITRFHQRLHAALPRGLHVVNGDRP